MLARFLLSLLFFNCLIAASIARGPIIPLQVGAWVGGSYIDDNSGSFSHCAVSGQFKSGQDLVIGAFPNGNWGIGIVDPRWKLSIGTQYSVRLIFDNSSPIDLVGDVRTDNMIFVQFSNSPEYLDLFRYGSVMYVTIGQTYYNFSLTNTKILMPALFECVSNALSGSSDSNLVLKEKNTKSQNKSDVDVVRDKIVTELGNEYSGCIDRELKSIVPYSNEGAEVLAQAIITKCEYVAQKFIDTTMAIFGLNRGDTEKIVNAAVDKRRNTILADIVTFRAAVNKAITSQPNQKPKDGKEQGTGL